MQSGAGVTASFMHQSVRAFSLSAQVLLYSYTNLVPSLVEQKAEAFNRSRDIARGYDMGNQPTRIHPALKFGRMSDSPSVARISVEFQLSIAFGYFHQQYAKALWMNIFSSQLFK